MGDGDKGQGLGTGMGGWDWGLGLGNCPWSQEMTVYSHKPITTHPLFFGTQCISLRGAPKYLRGIFDQMDHI